MRLETPHLVLMPIQFTDANDHHMAAKDALKDISTRFTWAAEPFTTKNSQTFIQEAMAAMREGRGHEWAIRTKGGKFVGGIGLVEIKDALGKSVPMFALNVWMRLTDPALENMGEAIQIAADHALRQLKARRVEVRINGDDAIIPKHLTVAGLRLEATLANTRLLPDGSAGSTQVWSKVA